MTPTMLMELLANYKSLLTQFKGIYLWDFFLITLTKLHKFYCDLYLYHFRLTPNYFQLGSEGDGWAARLHEKFL